MKKIMTVLCMAALLVVLAAGCASGKGYRNYGSTRHEDGWTRYESENTAVASIHNSTRVKDDPPGSEAEPFFSGGKAAGGLDKRGDITHVPPDLDWDTNNEIGYVKFKVTVPQADRYLAKILYNGDDDEKRIMVKVNNEPHQIIPLPQRAEGQWDLVHARQVELHLNEGENIVWVSGTIGPGWANIDCLDIRDTPLE